MEYLRRMIACSLLYIFSSSSHCIYKLTINTNGDYPAPSQYIYHANIHFLLLGFEVSQQNYQNIGSFLFYFQMSATSTGFSAYSPSYENIANRVCRLKQSKSSQNVGQIRPNSAQKVDINRLSTDTRENSAYRAKRRVSPSNLAIYDQQFTGTCGHYAGGVSRNSGIKKYNQRQLKEIGEGRAVVHLKTQSNLQRGPILNSIDNWTSFKPEKTGVTQIEIVRSASKLNQNMIPGRIYKREFLKTFFA